MNRILLFVFTLLVLVSAVASHPIESTHAGEDLPVRAGPQPEIPDCVAVHIAMQIDQAGSHAVHVTVPTPDGASGTIRLGIQLESIPLDRPAATPRGTPDAQAKTIVLSSDWMKPIPRTHDHATIVGFELNPADLANGRYRLMLTPGSAFESDRGSVSVYALAARHTLITRNDFDLNADGTLDRTDLIQAASLFASGSDRADFDRDGLLTEADLGAIADSLSRPILELQTQPSAEDRPGEASPATHAKNGDRDQFIPVPQRHSPGFSPDTFDRAGTAPPQTISSPTPGYGKQSAAPTDTGWNQPPADGQPAALMPGSSERIVNYFRFYNLNTSEHLYSTLDLEREVLSDAVGTWIREPDMGRIFDSPTTHMGVETIPYYRLYNSVTTRHLWTTDKNEYDTLRIEYPESWIAEGIDGYLLPSRVGDAVPLYRLRLREGLPLQHWTTDENEYDQLATTAWVQEGIVGYILPSLPGQNSRLAPERLDAGSVITATSDSGLTSVLLLSSQTRFEFDGTRTGSYEWQSFGPYAGRFIAAFDGEGTYVFDLTYQERGEARWALRSFTPSGPDVTRTIVTTSGSFTTATALDNFAPSRFPSGSSAVGRDSNGTYRFSFISSSRVRLDGFQTTYSYTKTGPNLGRFTFSDFVGTYTVDFAMTTRNRGVWILRSYVASGSDSVGELDRVGTFSVTFP